MANTYVTIGQIARESLRSLENQLVFAKGVRRNYDSYFGDKSAQIGDSITIRYPNRFKGRTGRVMSVEDVKHKTTSLKLNTQFGVDVVFTSQDLALSLGEFSSEFIQPAMATIANRIDLDGLKLYADVANTVGVPGTMQTDLGTYLNAGALMDEEAAPQDGLRSLIVTPRVQAGVINANKNLFNPNTEISEQYRSGNMGSAVGFKWNMSQNLPVHVVGPLGGVPLVNGAAQSGGVLITDGWTAAAALRLKKGDVFTIAGVYAVNPQSRLTTGQLRMFVVTADASSDAAGNMSVPIYPAIDGSNTSAWQNVTNVPADNAAITVLGAANLNSALGLAYHKDAFALGCVDLPLPESVGKGATRMADSRTGLSVRVIKGYDITNDLNPTRIDVLYGWKTLYPELAARIMN